MYPEVYAPHLHRAVGLTEDATDNFDAAQPAGDFAEDQNSTRWTSNSEAFQFAQAYRRRLLDMQEKMDDITALVEQFQQGLVDSESELGEVDDTVASYLELAGHEVESAGHVPGTMTQE